MTKKRRRGRKGDVSLTASLEYFALRQPPSSTADRPTHCLSASVHPTDRPTDRPKGFGGQTKSDIRTAATAALGARMIERFEGRRAGERESDVSDRLPYDGNFFFPSLSSPE